jgi:hypothetical protein
MVVERYKQGPEPVYARYEAKGRMLPRGLRYVDSWVVDTVAMDRCFQLMEADDRALFDEWFAHWDDLTEFELYPVLSSAEAALRALD